MAWTNKDGLNVKFGVERSTVGDQGIGLQDEHVLRVRVADMTALATSDTAAPAGDVPFIPAGAVIKDAYTKVTTACTSGGSATLGIGTKAVAGTTIDADGIDAAVAVAALGADAVVVSDGALIGTKVTVDSYITTVYGTAVFTAGAVEVVIKYVL